MSSEYKQNIRLMDLPFGDVKDAELRAIQKKHYDAQFSAFINRLITSVVVIAILMIGEYIGRYNSRPQRVSTIPGMFAALLAVLIIFNLLSYAYVRIKSGMDEMSSHLGCVYATVSEKFDARALAKNNKTRSKDYILFDTEDYHCETALAIDDYDTFRSLNTGSRILVVKSCPYGNESYEVYPLQQD